MTRFFGWMTLGGAAAIMVALGLGCAGYRRGSPVPPAFRTVHVPAFENRTVYPMVGAMAAQQFMDALIEDGTFLPSPYDSARLRVQAIVTSLESTAVKYDRNHAIVPDEYTLALVVKLYVFDRATGETYLNGKTITATDSALTRGDFQTGVTDALPRLARKLGQRLVEVLHSLPYAAEP